MAVRADIALFEYDLNQDAVVSTTFPAGSALDNVTGLGTIRLTFDTPGTQRLPLRGPRAFRVDQHVLQ